MAQLVAHRTCNAGVRGSSPLGSSKGGVLASKFELYTALCLFGFKDEVASVSMGYPTSLVTLKPHEANIADLETFWIRLAQAISDYPAIGYRIVHSRAFDDFCESYTNVQELVPRMHDFARALDVPG